MEICLFKVAGHNQRPSVFSEKGVKKWKQGAPVKNSDQEWNTLKCIETVFCSASINPRQF